MAVTLYSDTAIISPTGISQLNKLLYFSSILIRVYIFSH